MLSKGISIRDGMKSILSYWWVTIVAAICYGVWFFCLRGEACGVDARLNAEREARVFSRNNYGSDPSGVYCQSTGSARYACGVHFQGRSTYIQLLCDTDDPVTNDGCYRTSIDQEVRTVPSARVQIIGPHGETLGFIGDAGR